MKNAHIVCESFYTVCYCIWRIIYCILLFPVCHIYLRKPLQRIPTLFSGMPSPPYTTDPDIKKKLAAIKRNTIQLQVKPIFNDAAKIQLVYFHLRLHYLFLKKCLLNSASSASLLWCTWTIQRYFSCYFCKCWAVYVKKSSPTIT